MKIMKRVLAVALICLFVFAAMQIAASAADGEVAAQAISGSFGEFLIRLPVYLVNLLFTIIKAPFYFFAKIFGL